MSLSPLRMLDRGVSVRMLRECIRHQHRGYRAVPAGVLRRWWITLAAGFAAVWALTVALVVMGQRLEVTGALDWEGPALRRFVDAAPVTFNTAIWMDAAGNGLVLWLGVLTFAAMASWQGLALRTLTLLVGFTAAYVPFVTGWLLWKRARPLEVAGGIATPGALSSFPSGHVVQAVVAFGILAYLWASTTRSRGEALLACFIAAAGVAAVVVARLRLGAHWPTDIAAGAILGATWLAVLVLALRRAEAAASRADRRAHGRLLAAPATRGPLPRRALCSFLATAVDPSPKLRPNCGGGVVWVDRQVRCMQAPPAE